MSILWNNHYLYLVVAIGLSLLAVASSIIGSTLVLEKQSQLGDAIGHSSYPGVIIAYMIFQQRNPIILLMGAVAASLLSIMIIHWLSREKGFHFESILALVLSSFFGLGMVLMSYIQGNPHFAKTAQAGLNNYIMGQAAYLMRDDVITIGIVAIFTIFVFLINYPKIKIVLFDKDFATSIGINVPFFKFLNLLLAIVIIAVGLKAVGALLISSLLIAPTIIALQWSNQYEKVLIIGSIVSIIAAIGGTYLSTTIEKLATGPTVVLCLFIMTVLSLIIGPKSPLFKRGEAK